jgi:hypothetical protein
MATHLALVLLPLIAFAFTARLVKVETAALFVTRLPGLVRAIAFTVFLREFVAVPLFLAFLFLFGRAVRVAAARRLVPLEVFAGRIALFLMNEPESRGQAV